MHARMARGVRTQCTHPSLQNTLPARLHAACSSPGHTPQTALHARRKTPRAAPATAAAATGAPQLQPEQQQQHHAGDGAEEAAAAGPQSGEQWIDFLVAEMARCPDLTAARVRAGGVLQHFERFVKARSRDEVRWRPGCGLHLASPSPSPSALLRPALHTSQRKKTPRLATHTHMHALHSMVPACQHAQWSACAPAR